MTPQQREQALRTVRFEEHSRKHDRRVGLWAVIELLEHDDATLSHALDGGLHQRKVSRELTFVQHPEGTAVVIERRLNAKRSAKVTTKLKTTKAATKTKAIRKKAQ